MGGCGNLCFDAVLLVGCFVCCLWLMMVVGVNSVAILGYV